MRILHVAPYFAPAFCYGGPPRTILGLCQAQQRLAHKVTVFTTTANGAHPFPASIERPDSYEGISVHRFPLGMASRFFHAPELVKSLQVRAREFDVVHIHCLWNLASSGAARTCWNLGVPYVVSTRGMMLAVARSNHPWRKRISYPILESRVLRRAQFVHVTSDEEASEVLRLRAASDVVKIPNGVEIPPDLSSCKGVFRRQHGIGNDSAIVAWVGRIHRIKRLDLLAAAFAKVLSATPRTKLVLAGPDEGGYRAQVAPLFAQFGDAVTWTGELDGTGRTHLLADANVLVACSDVESFGMSIVEAMAAALPVVVTRSCPWPQIEQERCGKWVTQSAESISEALVELIRNPDEAVAMGNRGRQFVGRNYVWDSVARDMVAAYAKVLRGAEGERR